MSRTTYLFCQDCGKEIPDHPQRKTLYCVKCTRARRCKCGSFLPANPTKEHQCKSVDLKPNRTCIYCGNPLSYIGYERWHNVCVGCNKKRWREKEREQRKNLRIQFGGKCAHCGYNRYLVALHFHHLDSSEKYQWSKDGKVSLREIRAHPERFTLLCPTCHFETHEEEGIS